MRTQRSGGIEVRGVDLSFGSNHVLKSVDLAIEPGELFAFLGPSGCGKTTLLRLIAGFNRADKGEVLLDGEDIARRPPWQRNVGMVFQSYALWPHMSVARNVAFGLEERRLAKAEIDRRVQAALSLVGLAALAGRYPAQLSGGQQQRVALARTIAIEPKVLLLDEPLSNLDAQMRVQVRRELRELQRKLGITAIFVTHDQEEANSIADRMAVMKDGIVQQVGTPIELYERPANLFVAGFLGAANILSGTLSGHGRERFYDVAGGLRVAISADADVGAEPKLLFRPHHVEITGDPNGQGLVRQVEFLGANVRYSVAMGSQEIIVDRPFSSGASLVRAGTRVSVEVESAHALLLHP